MMVLDLSSIKKAIASLNRALEVSSEENLLEMSAEQQEVIKAGVIQKFEFTYELCCKFIKRWLEMNISPMIADGVTRRELFRLAAETQLIIDVEQWMRYHEARNLTSHLYQGSIVERVFAVTPAFAEDAANLLRELEARND